MNEIEQQILQIIKNSKKILIFSHIRPDWDAVSSLLLAKELISTNFPDKEILLAQEKGALLNADFLPGYTSIIKTDASALIKAESPDLIMLVDCPDFSRISFDLPAITNTYNSLTIPTIGIDHHEIKQELSPAYVSNNSASSAVEEIFELFVKKFDFKTTKNADLFLASGLISDTNNFLFLNASFKKTFETAAYLIEQGINFAEIDRFQNLYTHEHILLISEFLKNMTVKDFYTYTYISDEFVAEHPEIPRDRYSETKEIISLRFIRQVSNNTIIFIMYPEGDSYKGSFRGVLDQYDMTVFGRYLNGGGHKAAVGFKLPNEGNIQVAIQRTIEVITKYREDARML